MGVVGADGVGWGGGEPLVPERGFGHIDYAPLTIRPGLLITY